MKRLFALIRFFAWLGLFAWPAGWFLAWWLWPPVPRAGWQIPENEHALGFLSDSEHVLTEEFVGDKEAALRIGVMRVWNIKTRRLYNRYHCDPTARWRNLAHHRFVIQHKTIPGRKVTYFVSWPHDLEQLQVLDAWTGEVLFRDEHVHEIHLSYCISRNIIAYVREDKSMAAPEIVWRDLSNGKVLQTFPGMAGPIDFSPNGSRFLATRWNPHHRLASLVQIEVPSGVILRSMQVATQPNGRLYPQQSCIDDHVVEWTHGVLDWRTGKPIYSFGESLSLNTLSRDGRFLIEHKDERNEHSLQWIDLQKAQLDPQKAVIFAKGQSRGGGLGRFAQQESQWISATATTQADWPFLEKVPWFKQWLPATERLHFVIVDGYTGQVVAHGMDRQPSFHSPDGRLLVMREAGSNHDLIWNVPLDAGFPLPIAVAIAAALPVLVLWRNYRRALKTPPAISAEAIREVGTS